MFLMSLTINRQRLKACVVLGSNPHWISTGLSTESLRARAFTSRSRWAGENRVFTDASHINEEFWSTGGCSELANSSLACAGHCFGCFYAEELFCLMCPAGVQRRTGSRRPSSRAFTFNWGSWIAALWKHKSAAEASHPLQGEELRLKSWQGKTLTQGQKDHSEIFVKHKINL